MHANLCSGKWRLAANHIEYPHSSAKYYYTEEHGIYPVLNHFELRDLDLSKNLNISNDGK